MKSLVAAIAGVVFGVGLLLSGMTEPARVIGFLDVTGDWDPTLLFVMAGAVIVHAAVFWGSIRRRAAPWIDGSFHLPTRRGIDLRLIAGAAMFGVGWGLGGLCPGPSVVVAASGSGAAVAFVAAMIAGMVIQPLLSRAPAGR